MDDVKKDYREGEETAKETWRKADGEEDLADKAGNLGDDVRKELGNAGDTIDREVDERTDDRHPALTTAPAVTTTPPASPGASSCRGGPAAGRQRAGNSRWYRARNAAISVSRASRSGLIAGSSTSRRSAARQADRISPAVKTLGAASTGCSPARGRRRSGRPRWRGSRSGRGPGCHRVARWSTRRRCPASHSACQASWNAADCSGSGRSGEKAPGGNARSSSRLTPSMANASGLASRVRPWASSSIVASVVASVVISSFRSGPASSATGSRERHRRERGGAQSSPGSVGSIDYSSGSAMRGRAKPNSAPPVGRGAAQMRPSISSTMRFETASPRPVPGARCCASVER